MKYFNKWINSWMQLQDLFIVFWRHGVSEPALSYPEPKMISTFNTFFSTLSGYFSTLLKGFIEIILVFSSRGALKGELRSVSRVLLTAAAAVSSLAATTPCCRCCREFVDSDPHPESWCTQDFRISGAFPIFFGAGSFVTEILHRKIKNATDKSSLLEMSPRFVAKIVKMFFKYTFLKISYLRLFSVFSLMKFFGSVFFISNINCQIKCTYFLIWLFLYMSLCFIIGIRQWGIFKSPHFPSLGSRISDGWINLKFKFNWINLNDNRC